MPNEIKKKPEDNPLRCFVLVLFCVCLAMVLSAHLLYYQHIGEVRLFERVRLEEASRRLLVFYPNNSLVVAAHLGTHMPHSTHPYPCLHHTTDTGVTGSHLLSSIHNRRREARISFLIDQNNLSV